MKINLEKVSLRYKAPDQCSAMEGKEYLPFPLTRTNTPEAVVSPARMGTGVCSWQMTSSPAPWQDAAPVWMLSPLAYRCCRAKWRHEYSLGLETADAQRCKSRLGQPVWVTIAPKSKECRIQPEMSVEEYLANALRHHSPGFCQLYSCRVFSPMVI